ncbi:MAG TPA: SNF2-related protein, partial [Thermoguttaceae bacterium]|nr:SNF2-related protein [Thermoguttaceae bacterium]
MSVTSQGFDSVDASGGVSWHAPQKPNVISIDLRQEAASLRPTPCPVDFNHQLSQRIPIELFSVPLQSDRPRIVSVPIARTSVGVRSFLFDSTTDEKPNPLGVEPSGPRLHQPSAATLPSKLTRIKPPRDVIKLDDRLQYLLQPPLESLLAERALTFPFHPFPFQFEGIAFLYPRHAAVLADEMGLGKTMQAITAIRLLLRQREVRTVLLVCPKPLVTNWQREFELWAPEVTVSAV